MSPDSDGTQGLCHEATLMHAYVSTQDNPSYLTWQIENPPVRDPLPSFPKAFVAESMLPHPSTIDPQYQ
jgi:hypothetical protein